MRKKQEQDQQHEQHQEQQQEENAEEQKSENDEQSDSGDQDSEQEENQESDDQQNSEQSGEQDGSQQDGQEQNGSEQQQQDSGENGQQGQQQERIGDMDESADTPELDQEQNPDAKQETREVGGEQPEQTPRSAKQAMTLQQLEQIKQQDKPGALHMLLQNAESSDKPAEHKSQKDWGWLSLLGSRFIGHPTRARFNKERQTDSNSTSKAVRQRAMSICPLRQTSTLPGLDRAAP